MKKTKTSKRERKKEKVRMGYQNATTGAKVSESSGNKISLDAGRSRQVGGHMLMMRMDLGFKRTSAGA